MGVELSLKDMQEHAEQLQASRALVAQRLRQEGYERIDTELMGIVFSSAYHTLQAWRFLRKVFGLRCVPSLLPPDFQ